MSEKCTVQWRKAAAASSINHSAVSLLHRVPLDAIARMGVWNRCKMNHSYISNVDNSALLGAGNWTMDTVMKHPRMHVPVSQDLEAAVFPGLPEFQARCAKVSTSPDS